MIQRIQSVFLAVAAIVTIVLIFIPIGYIYTDQYYYIFTSFVVRLNVPEGGIFMTTFYIAILLFISSALSVVSIFQFKKRSLQLKINSINMFIFLFSIILMLYVYPDLVFVKKGLMTEADIFNFNYWILISIIPALSLYLANVFIKKDERLVRAADRLR